MTIDHPLPAAPEQLEELSAEGLGERRTPGFIRSAILTQPAALVGLGVLFFFVFIAIFGSYLEPYSIHDKTGPVYAPPSSAHWLGTDDWRLWTCSRC
jgi:ABC-type dipeptide/oligopeptide/nickel transport system permease subunit